MEGFVDFPHSCVPLRQRTVLEVVNLRPNLPVTLPSITPRRAINFVRDTKKRLLYRDKGTKIIVTFLQIPLLERHKKSTRNSYDKLRIIHDLSITIKDIYRDIQSCSL